MLKNNNLPLIAAGASLTSLGIGYLLVKQYLNGKKIAPYVEAMDNVLSKSNLMKKKKNKGKSANKKAQFDDNQLIHKNGFQSAEEDVKNILIESRNKKNKKILENEQFLEDINEEDELKKSLDDFEQVINSKIKISSAHFDALGRSKNIRRRKESAKNEFSEMISEELQCSAGMNNSVCLARVDNEAYICLTCDKINNKKNQDNLYQNNLSTEDDEDEEIDYFKEKDSDELDDDTEQYINQQLDILGVQKGVSTVQMKKETKKNKTKKNALPSLNQCQFYCWNCIQEHHQNHLVCQISSQSNYISTNPNLKQSASTFGQDQNKSQIYSPKLNAEQQIYLSIIREQMEMQQLNSQAIGLYCCSIEQILVTEESIPSQIENHLSQELNLIFDSLFDRVKQTQTDEFNNLLHIILKRIDDIMLDNNILIYIMGRILIKKNVIDRILRCDSLDSYNQKKLSEILMKMAKIDMSLRSEIAVILLQDFKYVFVSHILSSALLFMLKSPEVRFFVTQKLNKTSQFCAGLLNMKSIFEKFKESYKYRNKLMRCLSITRALCEDKIFVVEGILNKSTKQFSELLCDVARYLEKKSIIHRKDLIKNIIHTNIAEEIFYLKNLDFSFRQLFRDVIQNTHFAPEKYRQQLWQKLGCFLKQNIENYHLEVSQIEQNNKEANSHKDNYQNDYIYLNITSLNMLTMMKRDIRCNKLCLNFDDFSFEAKTIAKKYIFSQQEGYQILLLHHYGSVVNNPQNRCLFEHVKNIYGLPELGDFDLITYLQQSISDSNFINEIFTKTHFPCYDVYQNLRILFTDFPNQLGQLLINIFQINHQQMPLNLLIEELIKYVHIDNLSSLNLDVFCEKVTDKQIIKQYQKKYPHQPIYKLKELYYSEFFPLIFSKYPEDYEKLVKQQQLTFKLKQFDKHLNQQIGSQILSAGSDSSEEQIHNGPKILNANFFISKCNNNDIFGSDYDFILLKDRLIQFHSSIMDKVIPTTKAFFMIDKEDPLLIILFQSEAAPNLFMKSTQTPTNKSSSTISNLIPQNIFQKMKNFKSINKYLLEDIEYFYSNSQQQSIKLKRISSSSQ